MYAFHTHFGASMSDIFESMFGDIMGRRGRGTGPARERGADLRYNMEITLEDAFAGKVAQVRMPTPVACEACGGSGAKPGSKPVECRTCNGQGKIRASQGFFLMERTCHVCQGRGEIVDDPCGTCSGQGRVTRERTLQVNIPPGVEEGTRIRLGGEGEAGMRGGPSGDLYIFLSLAPHELFQRDGADLYCRVPIAMTDAALGGEIEVPTISGGREKVKISDGTQSGKQFRIKGKGMPVLRARETGDLYIQVDVEIPKNLSKKQRELLEEFRKATGEANHPDSAGFFARVKDMFGARED
jgi:molecular chaperone DnaJ